VQHRVDGGLRALGEQPLQSIHVSTVERRSPIDLEPEPAPAREAVLTRDGQLRRIEDEAIGHRMDPRQRLRVPAPCRSEEVLREPPELFEIGTCREVGHDISFVDRRSASPGQRSGMVTTV
jgi:hypothetical protein